MAIENLLERITVDTGKCGGRPCIRGMRIRVQDILGMLSEGMEISEILDDYPYLERADIRAVQLLAKRNEQHNLLLK